MTSAQDGTEQPGEPGLQWRSAWQAQRDLDADALLTAGRAVEILGRWGVSAATQEGAWLHAMGVPTDEAAAHGVGARALEVVRNLDRLDPPDPGKRRGAEQSRADLTDRLRALFYQAYVDLDPVLAWVALHAERVNLAEDSVRAGRSDATARGLAETTEVVALPLLEMLGHWELRRHLGAIALKYRDRHLFDRIADRQAHIAELRATAYLPIEARLKGFLVEMGLAGRVQQHQHGPASVQRRMRQGSTLSEIAKALVIDVVLPSREDCYRLLGAIHGAWSPVPGRTRVGGNFRDLMTAPRFNGYRALATTVLCERPDGGNLLAEFRFLTEAMERTNLMGVVAALFLPDSPETLEGAWWSDAERKRAVAERPPAARSDHVYVFSPIGEVYDDFPDGSTAIDFAFKVHSSVGRHCRSIAINGRPAPPGQVLRNGDLVEITIDHQYQAPYELWEPHAKTAVAKAQLRRLREQLNPTHPGRRRIDAAITAELESLHLPQGSLPEAGVEQKLRQLMRGWGYDTLEALYAEVDGPHAGKPGATGILPGGAVKTRSAFRVAALVMDAFLAPYVERSDGQPIAVPVERIHLAHCNVEPHCRPAVDGPIVGRLIKGDTPNARLKVFRAGCVLGPEGDGAIPLVWRTGREHGFEVRVKVDASEPLAIVTWLLAALGGLDTEGVSVVGLEVITVPLPLLKLRIRLRDSASQDALERLLAEAKERGLIRSCGVKRQDSAPLATPALPMTNPYGPMPVLDPRIFKGRRRELDEVRAQLLGPARLVMVVGANRIGKTSFLRHLATSDLPTDRFLPAYLDLQAVARWGEAGLWADMGRAVAEVAARRLGVKARRLVPEWQGVPRSTEIKAWLDRLRTLLPGRRVVVLLDEVNLLDELHEDWDSRERDRAIRRFKALAEDEFGLRFVMSIQAAYLSGPREPALKPLVGISHSVTLDHLDAEAAQELIRQPLERRLDFDPGLVARILALTGCHPLYLHKILSNLVEQAGRGQHKVLGPRHLDEVVSGLLDSNAHHFYDFMRPLARVPERAVVYGAAVIGGGDGAAVSAQAVHDYLASTPVPLDTSAIAGLLDRLRLHGLLARVREAPPERYVFRVPLFAEWLRSQHDLHWVMAGSTEKEPSAW